MSEEMKIRWTARLVDPLKTDAVADGSGDTPEEAYVRLVEHLRWKSNREHERVGQIDTALEVALRDSAAHRASP